MFADWSKFSMGPQGRPGPETFSWEQAELRGSGFSPGEEAALGGPSNNPQYPTEGWSRSQSQADGVRTWDNETHKRCKLDKGRNLLPLRQRVLKEREGCITANTNWIAVKVWVLISCIFVSNFWSLYSWENYLIVIKYNFFRLVWWFGMWFFSFDWHFISFRPNNSGGSSLSYCNCCDLV